MSKVQQLAEIGQAVWLDLVRRSFVVSADLQAQVDRGLGGLTANPTVLAHAIAGSTDYDEPLRRLAGEGKTVAETYEALALEDVRRAVDALRSVHDRRGGEDGYVVLDIHPDLALDAEGMFLEGRRLFDALDRPNVMLRLPANAAGISATEQLVAGGISVAVTLMFSIEHYEAAVDAYIAALAARTERGEDLSAVTSVASLSISSVDSAVDRALAEIGTPQAFALQGKVAIANARAIYARFQEIVTSERWQRLAAHGARVQRLLWADTRAANPLYPDTLYVDQLIGPHTVTQLAPATLRAFRDQGTVRPTLEAGLEEAQRELASLARLGLDLKTIAQTLQDEGIEERAHIFAALAQAIVEKRDRLVSGWRARSAELGPLQSPVEGALAEMAEERVVTRLWTHDHTVWKPEPREITNRLGWLDIAHRMQQNVSQLENLLAAVRTAGYTQGLLLGMGGSSLAPEMFSKTLGAARPHGASLQLSVLSSTDPGAVWAQMERLDLERALFIVSSKSGTTVETLSLFKFFYNQVADEVGADRAGEHFVAITDPGSPLAKLAEAQRFRAIFLNDTRIGGRYSALSYFGLVPAALAGTDVPLLLERALDAAAGCAAHVPLVDNPAAWLGAILGQAARAGRDKATFVLSPAIDVFGDWLEQLIAESTGKEGKGVLPVVGEPLGPPEVYGDDRLFIHVRLEGDESQDEALAALQEAGHPLLTLNLCDLYDLGGQIFLWEVAVALAGHRLGIHPFNQPDVEAAKKQARRMVDRYKEQGELPEGELAPLDARALVAFLDQASPGDYIALQAYVPPTALTDAALTGLRIRLRDALQLATTTGYGPRYLHSIGQLYKGDAGNGLFIQFVADTSRDLPIPEEPESWQSTITFGVLETAQALGDYRALLDAGRRVIRFDLGGDVVEGLEQLARGLAQ